MPEDDWPYLYLQQRQIPTLHLIMTAIVIFAHGLGRHIPVPRKKIGPSHFLFLGAGFMLLEVHSISKVSLLFGSTWMVNVVIISAILIMILFANLLSSNSRIERVNWWYAGLFASLVAAYLIPVHSLILGSYLARGILAGDFLFAAHVLRRSDLRNFAQERGRDRGGLCQQHAGSGHRRHAGECILHHGVCGP